MDCRARSLHDPGRVAGRRHLLRPQGPLGESAPAGGRLVDDVAGGTGAAAHRPRAGVRDRRRRRGPRRRRLPRCGGRRAARGTHRSRRRRGAVPRDRGPRRHARHADVVAHARPAHGWLHRHDRRTARAGGEVGPQQHLHPEQRPRRRLSSADSPVRRGRRGVPTHRCGAVVRLRCRGRRTRRRLRPRVAAPSPRCRRAANPPVRRVRTERTWATGSCRR